jgi:hypothetical protein
VIDLRIDLLACGFFEVRALEVLGFESWFTVGSRQSLGGNDRSGRRADMIHGARDGLDEKRGAEHIGVVDLAHGRIVGKVHRQAAHHRIPLAGAHPGQAVDVRQQTVAQMRRIEERVVDLGRERFEDVGLAFDARSVNAIDRIESAELMPAGVELLVLGIVFAANILTKKPPVSCVQ